MRRARAAAFLMMMSVAVVACSTARPRTAAVPDSTLQLLVVRTDSWDATPGEMRRFERGNDGRWQAVSAWEPVVVGRTGLAWGAGLPLPLARAGGPVKAEGDGKAPAGLFALTDVFGYAAEAPQLRMPYVVATPTLECVDDPASPYYNRLVETTYVKKTWSSSEMMRRNDELYRYGVVVAHNATPVTPRGGSCIFLHVWSGRNSVTAGCTAMPAEKMQEVIAWLDAGRAPLLLQLPKGELRKLSLPFDLDR